MEHIKDFLKSLEELSTWIKVYALVLSIIGVVKSTPKLIHLWNTRNLRKAWGIKDKENVIVICSELDDPEDRQNVEPKEFIYNLKYGDVDAYFEVIVTLLRLYPKLKLRILSSGEAENTRFDMAQTIILIGGPDYNHITSQILSKNITQFIYKSPYCNEQSCSYPNEIVLYHKQHNKEYFDLDDLKDYGYFERINNPHNPKKKIILIGGCHTLGVTAAVKAFSLSNSEHGEIPNVVLDNSRKVAKKIKKAAEFVVILQAERIGQSINTPIIKDDSIFIKA